MIDSKKTFRIFLYIFIPVLFASLFLTVYYGESFGSIPLYAVIGLQLYLLGSVPWGYIVYRIRTGRDIREYGSGKIGTSNIVSDIWEIYRFLSVNIGLPQRRYSCFSNF